MGNLVLSNDKSGLTEGYNLLQQGKYQEAVDYYEKVVLINPRDDISWFHKGYCLSSLGKYNEAIVNYETALQINPTKDDIWSAKGFCLYSLGRYIESNQNFDKALLINPNNDYAWFKKGNCLYSLGRYQEALECYDRALRIDSTKDNVWYGKGLCLYSLGRYKEAVESYDKALVIDSRKYDTWCSQGNCLYSLGRYEEAAKCFESACQIDGSKDDTWYYLGNCLSTLRRYQQAVESFDKALQINPNKRETWCNRGLCLYELGDYEEAAKSFDNKLESDIMSDMRDDFNKFQMRMEEEGVLQPLSSFLRIDQDETIHDLGDCFDEVYEDQRVLTEVKNCLTFVQWNVWSANQQAIYLYTCEFRNREESIYWIFNKTLTDPTRTTDTLRPWRFYFHYLKEGLKELPKWQPTARSLYLYRGVDVDLITQYPKKYYKSSKFTWYSFVSTTSNIEVACEFLRKKKTITTLIQITNNLSGRSIGEYSARPTEHEVLFPPFCLFEIIQIKKTERTNIMSIKQIESPLDEFGLEK